MLEYVSLLGVLVVCIGLVGLISRRNIFVIYMSIELMLNGVALLLVAFSRYHADMQGSILTLFLIAIIAAEAALFLAMIMQLIRVRRSIDSDRFNELGQKEAE